MLTNRTMNKLYLFHHVNTYNIFITFGIRLRQKKKVLCRLNL